jgi:hypothetical protein
MSQVQIIANKGKVDRKNNIRLRTICKSQTKSKKV